MKMPFSGRRVGLILFGLFLLIATGCSTTGVKTVTVGPAGGIKSILVLPFDDLAKIYSETGLIKCPLCDYFFEAGPVPPNAVDWLSERLVDILGQQATAALITHDRSFDYSEQASSTGMLTERKLMAQAGRSSNADAVLTGYIYRYEERVGTPFAASRPASVAFSLHLIRSADGADVWFGYVDETQQALSENLFNMAIFWQRRGRWVSADEMAQAGLTELLDKFPKQ
ncbi:MAG: hypothetical protein PVG81_09600 [Desulfobacterales bacterium]|jgi:hypothetical protein